MFCAVCNSWSTGSIKHRKTRKGDGRFLIYQSHTDRNKDYFIDTELSQKVLTGVNILHS